MDQQKAPLYEALMERRLRGESSFHVPGHKFGAILETEQEGIYGPIMGLDYTEIEGLDDLHHPEGVILEAERLAAECFGAEESFFLVGGSTVGNLAAIATVCSRGDRILVQRNVHKSVLHGLMLAGAEAVFVQPELDPDTGLATGIAMEVLKLALSRNPQAKAVFLSNPNYYGMGMDLRPYAELVHTAGLPLLVDEAHGAHFGLHHAVPPSALSRGADVVVQSTHKMLTAMTMGAMLHVQGPRIDRARLKQRLAMLQSSSPSYPLMASLDLARRTAATAGTALMEERIPWLRHLSAGIRLLTCIRQAEWNDSYDYLDPFKITLYDRSGRLSGFQLQEQLGHRGIISEMADDRHALLACSLATDKHDLERLLLALQDIDGLLSGDGEAPADNRQVQLPDEPLEAKVGAPMALDMDASCHAGSVSALPLEEAIGRRSAETVIPYPPGIPLLFAGEIIRPEAANRIRQLALAGARFQGGLQDPSGCSILVRIPPEY